MAEFSPSPISPIPQAQFPDLPELDAAKLHIRRERTLLVFAGIFLGAMAMLNILGITKFVQLGPLAVAVGVLPYPLTFLCTDFISEFYGRRCANFIVFIGLLVNLLVLGFISLGSALESVETPAPFQQIYVPQTGPIETLSAGGPAGSVDPGLPDNASIDTVLTPLVDESGETLRDAQHRRPVREASNDHRVVFREEGLFDRISMTTRMAVLASMIAYLAAQFIDVYLFHFWKRLTRGKHLWLRNNGSTLVSQLVDTTAVVLITFWASIVAGDLTISGAVAYIRDGYSFKLLVALIDTVPFYIGVKYLGRYLRIRSTD